MPIQFHISSKSHCKPRIIPIINFYPAIYRNGMKVVYADFRVIWLKRTVHIIFGKKVYKS